VGPQAIVAEGLYLLGLLDAINIPYTIIDKPDEISLMSRFDRQTHTVCRPMAVLLTRDLLRGSRG
jgi:sulfopyruvate decarboxylase TPP-binding subunit